MRINIIGRKLGIVAANIQNNVELGLANARNVVHISKVQGIQLLNESKANLRAFGKEIAAAKGELVTSYSVTRRYQAIVNKR